MKRRKPTHAKPDKIEGAPGQAWRPRADYWVAVWVCNPDIAAAGYSLKTLRIWPPSAEPHAALTDADRAGIRAECQRLQDEMHAWHRGGTAGGAPLFDGTLSGLIECYRRDKDSGYQQLRYASRREYEKRLGAIDRTVGPRAVREIKGRDFKRWFENWSAPRTPGGPRRTAYGHALITTLRILFSFGVALEYDYDGCLRLQAILGEQEFEGGKSRTEEITAEQATAVRECAHAGGRPSIALAQAIQFDLALRQKDVIGEWVPVDEPGLSDIHMRGAKWVSGIDWREISPDLILTHRISKSVRGRRAVADARSGKIKVFDLKLYPMVMEEIARIPGEARVGPVIVSERTGLPYWRNVFPATWRGFATEAGVPPSVQNRDSRAGGLTEGIEASDGDLEAVRNAAGHSRQATTRIYNRGEERQTAKVAVLRAAKRDSNTPQ